MYDISNLRIKTAQLTKCQKSTNPQFKKKEKKQNGISIL